MTTKTFLAVVVTMFFSIAAFGADTQTAPLKPAGEQQPAPIHLVRQGEKQNDQATENPAEDTTGPADITYISSENAPLDKKARKAVRLSAEWRRRAVLPTFEKDGAVIFTFGESEPVLVCKPLMVCVIRLEQGEKIIDKPHCGDAARWDITPSDNNGERPPHIYVKPLDSGLVTDLAINTNRRTYIISLKSRNDDEFTPLIAFWYPENEQKNWSEFMAEQKKRDEENARDSRINAAGDHFDASRLDFNYALSGDDPKWKPVRVFNDGRKTYIETPSVMQMYEAPVLLTVNDGTNSLVNYRLHGNTFIVDQLFDKAVLISGVGDNQTKVTITHVN
jgi:type IV secretion system protein TrbG